MRPDALERSRLVLQISQAAMDFEAGERTRFVAAACQGDDELRREVESILFRAADTEMTRTMTSELETPASLTGQRFGAYELGPLLAAGGMGEVYAAHDPRLGRDVAVKVVPSGLADDPARLKRLEREARAAAALNHPNILAVHDVGTHDGVPYIVMERVPGETLGARLRRGPMPMDTALDITAQVADALAAVHARGILHRDLKPANVMVMPDGRVKVLDFGLAKIAAEGRPDQQYTTSTGHVFGTPAYMAPEELGGRSGDPRADIYSLGVILFEAVTGRRPFQAADFMSAAVDKLSNVAPLAADVEPSVPAALSNLISRCLERDPDRRPASAAALKAEIERIRSELHQPAGFRDAAARMQLGLRKLKSWRLAVPAAAAAALVAAVALTGTAVWRWRAPATAGERPVIAILPFENASGEASNDYVGAGIADTLTAALSRVTALSVVSREAVRDAARSGSDAAALARELGATLLVQGRVRRSGERLDVEATLARPDGNVLWAGTVGGTMADLFSVERALAERLLQTLRIPASAGERRQLDTPPTASRDALEAYWRGVALLEQRTDAAGIVGAAEHLSRAVTADPDFAMAHAALGAALIARFRTTNDNAWLAPATQSITRALEIDPTQPAVRMSLAFLYQMTGRNASAVEELHRVLAADPANDQARRRLGTIFQAEGRPDDALREFESAVVQRPSYWLNHDALGRFYYSEGRYADAVRAFTRVTELRPELATAYSSLGTAHAALGERAVARQHLEHAIRIAPTAAGYTNLGNIHYIDGNFEDAIRAYREAIALRPDRALYRRNLGDAYTRLQRFDEARREYLEAVRLTEADLRVNPNNALAIAQLAVYTAKIGQHADAAQHIARALSMTPQNPEVLFRHAVVLALAGNADASLRAVAAAIEKGYAVDLVREDDDLAVLRGNPEFQALLSPRK